MLRRKKAKMGKTHCFTCFKMRLHLRWSTTIFSQLPHMRTTISPEFWIVYIPINTSTCIRTLKKAEKSCKGAKRQKWAKSTVSLASKCALTCADLPWFSPDFHTCAQAYHLILSWCASHWTCLHALEHLKKTAGLVRGAPGIKRHNALFHLLQNAPRPALIYHDFLPTSTHAHKYITWSLASVHPTEHVYLH